MPKHQTCTSDDLEKLKQPALRQIAKGLELSAGGTNADLRKRIREHQATAVAAVPASPAPAVAAPSDDLEKLK